VSGDKGLLSEGEQMIAAKGDLDVQNAALIAAAQRVEHYEMSGYSTARTFALRLGHTDAAHLLQTTLQEEKAADQQLGPDRRSRSKRPRHAVIFR
jgi:ferritin-like metal-binding protein YciE